jgi:flagellum-specific ATP synthase
MIIEASGLSASIGEICVLTSSGKQEILAEVVGFRDDNILLMPYGDIEGIGVNSLVKLSKRKLNVPVGDFLIGERSTSWAIR